MSVQQHTAAACGQYLYDVFTTQPADLRAFLSAADGGGPLSSDTIAAIFSKFAPTSLSFAGKALSRQAQDQLIDEVSRCSTLLSLSLSHLDTSTFPFNFANFTECLIGNVSLTQVDLQGLGLTPADGDAIAQSVIPWNRTVVSWNFEENRLGDEGVLKITEAFTQSMSSVQRVSFKDNHVHDVAAALQQLMSLTSLVQLDMAGNPGCGAPNAQTLSDQVDAVLVRNYQMLYPGTALPQRQAFHLTATRRSVSPTSAAPTETTPSGRPLSRKETSPPTSAENTSFGEMLVTQTIPEKVMDVLAPKAAADRPASARKPETRNIGGTSSARGSAVHRDPNAVQRSGSNARSSAVFGASRTHSSRTSSPVPSATSSARGRATERTIMADIQDGADRWQQIKNQYNQYIRSPSGSPARRSTQSPSRRVEQPKYLFGKRIDKIKETGSPGFQKVHKEKPADPTPEEIRKYAPWHQPGFVSTPGKSYVMEIPNGHPDGQMKLVKFVDGGSQRSVTEDTRDVGYWAKKVREGRIRPAPSPGFTSNTTREVRWGADPTQAGFVHKQAQAPGPGFYTIESEWTKNARKLRENARTHSPTGKPTMSGTSAPRTFHIAAKQGPTVPGPGAYEIP